MHCTSSAWDSCSQACFVAGKVALHACSCRRVSTRSQGLAYTALLPLNACSTRQSDWLTVPCAVCCAMLCAVLCCAVLCCAVLCCHPTNRTQVYTAEYSGHLLAIKLFRYSSSTMDYAASSHPPQLHGPAGAGGAAGPAAAGISSLLGHHGTSSSSGGNVASEAELEAVLSLQYRLCNMQHEHLLQHVAVYPRVFEVCVT